MLRSEFEDLTGFNVTEEEYAQIEACYLETDIDKQTFCMHFCETGGPARIAADRLKEIRKLKNKLRDEVNARKAETESLKEELEKVRTQLDRELLWKPCEGGTNMGEELYESLRITTGTRVLTEDEARELINREFGFDRSMITFVSTVSTYESNKYHRMRVKDSFERQVLYNASDWNYARFDVTGWQYELINGALTSYNS